MAGKKLSDVDRGDVLAQVRMENTSGNRNAEYWVQIVRLSTGLVVRTKWGAIGAKSQVKDFAACHATEASREYGRKIVAKEGKGYAVVSGARGVSLVQLESQAERDERLAKEAATTAKAADAKREAAMGAMDRAAVQAAPYVPAVVAGEEIYDEV